MKYDCTGVILAGGTNNRFPGEKKAFRKIGQEMILETIYQVFSVLFKEVIIVVNEPRDFVGWDMTLVTDIYPSRCALAGLHTGLFHASYQYAYVTACDTPFLNPGIIEFIIDQIEPGYDVIIPRTNDGVEPLSAVYSKECIPFIEENLVNNIYMIKKFFRRKKVKELPAEKLKQIDPDLRFAFNINTQHDYEKAKEIAGCLKHKDR